MNKNKDFDISDLLDNLQKPKDKLERIVISEVLKLQKKILHIIVLR